MASGGVRAARKRYDSVDAEEFLCEPLDVQVVPVVGRDGQLKQVPALNIGFMEPRRYVMYRVLPSIILASNKKCSDAEIDEWLERTSYYEDDLKWLLKLPCNRFWSQVIYDEDLQICLQSYLSIAPRDYDLNISVREDILLRQKEIHKLIFLVFLRMSTFKESKMHHITPNVFGEIIYENFIFDIPRMMDLCVLYGFRNPPIVSRMVHNLFTNQPSYINDLEDVLPYFLMAFENTQEMLGFKTNTINEMGSPEKLSDARLSLLSALHSVELLDIVNYITDISATLFSFLEAYSEAGYLFCKCQVTIRIPSFYDLVLPTLETEISHRTEPSEYQRHLDVMASKLMLSKSFFVRAFRNIVTSSCIHPLLNARCSSNNDNEDAFHLNSYLQIFTDIATEKQFLQDYNQLFPFSADLEMFAEASITIDPASLSYILSLADSSNNFSLSDKFRSSVTMNGPTEEKLEHQALQNHNASGKVQTLQDIASGLNSGKFQHQRGSANESSAGASPSAPDEVQVESLIHVVLDVMPDLGDGFVKECLEYYNYNSESVIDALLTDNLPPHISSLDRNFKRKKTAILPAATNTMEPNSILSERRSIFDYDEFDIFNREDVAMDKIHMGKSGKTPLSYEALTNDSESSVLKDIILQYEADYENKAPEEPNLYEDEYDDTYDSHDFHIIEAQPETELVSRSRLMTTPIALRSSRNVSKLATEDEAEESEEEEETNEVSGNAEQKHVNTLNITNPELVRQQQEARREAKMNNRSRGRGRGGNAPGDNSRVFTNKEKNKSYVANHNRRHQSDYKKSRGMVFQ